MQQRPQRNFGTEIDPVRTRQKRQLDVLSLRKQNRSELLLKRREILTQQQQDLQDEALQAKLVNVQQIIRGLLSSEKIIQLENCKLLSDLVGRIGKRVIDEIIDQDCLFSILQLISDQKFVDVSVAAAFLLLRCTYEENTKLSDEIIRIGGISQLCSLLITPQLDRKDVTEKILWIIGNLAGESRA
ncbi:MAG: hypothetical protein EZS28_044494, partial [Streblomastix strix]